MPLRIAVILPTYAPHIKYLRVTLQSLEAQTRQPDLVVIAASSIEPESEAASELQRLAALPFPFPLQILQTAAVQAAGKNRNDGAAAAVAAGADVMSFLDSDDLMAPRRLGLVERTFLRNGNAAAAVVHDTFAAYTREGVEWPAVPEDPRVVLNGEGVKHEPAYSVLDRAVVHFQRPFIQSEEGEECSLACGHISVRADVFSKVQFHTKPTYCEDVQFLADLIYYGYPVAYLDAKLTLYLWMSDELKREYRKDV